MKSSETNTSTVSARKIGENTPSLRLATNGVDVFLAKQLAERELTPADGTFESIPGSQFLGDNNVPQFRIVTYDADGKPRLNRSRIRFDTSHQNCPKDDKGKPIKYKLPFASGVVIFNPSPTSHAEWVQATEKWIAEGEFKAIALAKLGKVVKGIGGCRGWHLKQSDDLHPDLRYIRPGDRVTIAMDGDWHTNSGVHVGTHMLMQAIRRVGGRPFVLDLPAQEPKLGIDDLIAQWRRENRDVEAELTALPRLEDIPNPFVVDPKRPLEVARCFVDAAYPTRTLARWRNEFYRWQGQGWASMDEETVRAQVYQFLDLNRGQPSQAFVTKIVDALRADVLLDIPDAPTWRGESQGDPHNLLAVANGLLDLQTRELFPHSPLFFNVNWSAVEYFRDATCPAWLQFLNEVFPNDPEAIALVQEWIGYCLTEDTRQQKMLMMVGAKRSGKGTIAYITEQLIGPDGFCSPTFHSLGSRFGLHPLVGKKVAVIGDARLSGRTDSQATVENMLRISGEDKVDIDRKHLTELSVRLSTRLWVITNLLPGMLDEGGAFASRFLVLSHRVSFFGREDQGLRAKLLTELPGILNWSLDGLARLHARGHFVQPESGKAKLHDLERVNSPVKAFVEDRCTLGPKLYVEKDSLFAAFVSWQAATGSRMGMDKERFTQALSAATDEQVRAIRKRLDGKQIQVYAGIRLRAQGVQGVQGVQGRY